MKSLFPFFALLALSTTLFGQKLKPGFDKAEYIEMLKVSAQVGDSAYIKAIPQPQRFKFAYRSPVVGLENRWDLFVDNQSVAVISIRGTTNNSVSWLGNIYAAMVPAKGEIQLNDTETFTYALAANPRAAVHVGWLVTMGFLAKDILPKIDSCYRAGIKYMLIMGHSQGGALAFLFTSHVYNLQKQGRIPADIRFKTYCSAGPKPGNRYYAYEYEAATQGGWAYNVVNSADWVPEVPLTVQTVNDFNTTNPFTGAPAMIKKQKLLNRIVLKHLYNNMSKPSLKAQKNYQKYLGALAAKTVRKNLTGYVSPAYYTSSDYVRTGNTIVLLGDSAYFNQFPDSKDNVFIHHLHPPYLYLAQKLPPTSDQMQSTSFLQREPSLPTQKLAGSWELTYIAGRQMAFEGLYPQKKPFITFDPANQRLNGSTSCNSFKGKLVVDGAKIIFTEPMAMTLMLCSGEGEQAFLDGLKTVNRYTIHDDNTLTLFMGDIAVMRFSRK